MKNLRLGLRLSEIGSGILKALFLYLNPFNYKKDANGNLVVTNQGSGSDLLMATGRHLNLDATQYVDVPIHHTLGADTKQAATLGAGWTDNTGHSYTGATASSSLSNLSTGTSVPSVLIDFTITAYTSGSVGGYSALGTYTIESTIESLTGVSFVGTVLINSVKQITNPNSFLTYHDITTNKIITLGNSVDGESSKGNLFLYGAFDTDVSLYSSVDAGDSLTWINGRAYFQNVTLNYGGFNLTSASNILSITKTYMITVEIELVTATLVNIDWYPGFNAGSITSSGTFTFTINPSLIYFAPKFSLGINNNIAGRDFYVDNISVKEILPMSTKYRFQGITGGLKINSILRHKSAWDTTDATAIDANPNLVGALALSPTRSIPELNKVLDVTDECFMCSELSGATITGAKNVTAATIANYTTAARIKGATKGLQLSAFPSDALGVPLSYTTDRLVYHPDQTITIPLTTPIVHTMTKDIAKIEGSATSVVVTHSDATTLTLP